MQVLLTASKQIQDGTAEQTGSRLALTTAQAAPLLCQFMSAYVMHFLVSLFARAGSVVPGPVGLGLLLLGKVLKKDDDRLREDFIRNLN